MANLSDFLSGGGGTLGELDDVTIARLFQNHRLHFDARSEAWVNDYGELIIRGENDDLWTLGVDAEGNLTTTLLDRAVRPNFLSNVTATTTGSDVIFNINPIVAADDPRMGTITGWRLTCFAPQNAIDAGADASRIVSEGDIPAETLPGSFSFTEQISGTYEYELVLFDSNGADSITTQEIRFFAAPQVTITTVFGDGQTAATLTANVRDDDNPAGPFLFVWSKDGSEVQRTQGVLGVLTNSLSITNDASNTADGVYTIVITDPDMQTGMASETIDLNGPVSASLTHQGSTLIDETSFLVANTDDADGAQNLGAWSITRTRGTTAAESLFTGTGQLDGTTLGQGMFSVMNSPDENMDDVYTLQATDTAATPHVVTATATVDVINEVTLNIIYVFSSANGSVNQTTDTFVGIPGTAIPNVNIDTSANSGFRLAGNPSCGITPSVAGPTCVTVDANTVRFGGVFPNTSENLTVRVTQTVNVDLPDLSVSLANNSATVSPTNVTYTYTFTSNCPNGRNSNGTGRGTVGVNGGNDPACLQTCTNSFTASATGFDNGVASVRKTGGTPTAGYTCLVNPGGGFRQETLTEGRQSSTCDVNGTPASINFGTRTGSCFLNAVSLGGNICATGRSCGTFTANCGTVPRNGSVTVSGSGCQTPSSRGVDFTINSFTLSQNPTFPSRYDWTATITRNNSPDRGAIGRASVNVTCPGSPGRTTDTDNESLGNGSTHVGSRNFSGGGDIGGNTGGSCSAVLVVTAGGYNGSRTANAGF